MLGIVFIIVGATVGLTFSQFPWLLGNSLLVTGGSALISVVLGGLIGWILGWTQIRGRRYWLTLLLVWMATPLIIQLSAWDALWGRLSWASALMDVRYSRWFDGMLAVILVHGFSNIPWVALLLVMGKRWGSTNLEQDSLMSQGPLRTLWTVTLPRQLRWLVLAGLIVGVRVFEQFEVTDVYQVRTWAEIWYLGFSLGELQQWDAGGLPSVQQLTQIVAYPFTNANSAVPLQAPTPVGGLSVDAPVSGSQFSGNHWSSLTAMAPFCLLLGTVAVLFSGLKRYLSVKENAGHYRSDRLPAPAFARVLLWILVALPIGMQLANLFVRAGVRVESGSRGWSLAAFGEMMRYSGADYMDAATWSFLIGLVSAALVCCFGFLLGWGVRNRGWLQNVVFVLALLLFALPSPLVSLYVYQTLNLSQVTWIRHLSSTSIFAPVIALSIKHLGLSVGMWLVLLGNEAASREDLLAMSGMSAWNKLSRFGVRRYWKTGFGFGFIFLVLGAGDLSTTFATVPPGMDTFARRILGDLHAGAGSQVAAACLWQVVLIAASGMMAMAMFSNERESAD